MKIKNLLIVMFTSMSAVSWAALPKEPISCPADIMKYMKQKNISEYPNLSELNYYEFIVPATALETENIKDEMVQKARASACLQDVMYYTLAANFFAWQHELMRRKEVLKTLDQLQNENAELKKQLASLKAASEIAHQMVAGAQQNVQASAVKK